MYVITEFYFIFTCLYTDIHMKVEQEFTIPSYFTMCFYLCSSLRGNDNDYQAETK